MATVEKLRRMTWLPVVDDACCCCSLNTFNKLHGFVAVICSFFGMTVFMALCIKLDCSPKQVTDEDVAKLCKPEVLLTVLLYLIFCGVIEFVTSLLFLIGIYQSKPGMMTPFVVHQHINVIVAIHSWMMFAGNPLIPGIASFISMVPVVALQIYLLVCANSQRVQLEYSQNGMLQQLNNVE